ncbi:MAG: TonB C-terminal domain-containing protein [Pseudomonadota bacterium]
MTEKKSIRRRLPMLAGSAFLVLFVVGALWMIRGLMVGAESPKARRVQQISLVKPPLPPPPEEQPPEPETPKPEEIKEELNKPEPEQAPPGEPPAGPDLGVDTQGGAGGDAFGLVGKPGGRDITTIGGGGSRFAWYTAMVQQQIQAAFVKNKKLRGEEFKVILKLWFESNGSLARFELAGTAGKAQTDDAIKVALAQLAPLKDLPPNDMPQPVKLRVTNHF